MIGTRTPFRFSFVGGGSDVAAFYEGAPGKVISVTVNKYMYIMLHPYFSEKFLIKYSTTELVDTVEQVKHPIVQAALRRFSFNGLDINSIADIPSGTGLGSSSAFTVGLLHALYAQAGMFVGKERLADEACQIEIEELKEPIGKQDQYAAAYGGLNRITFQPSGHVDVEPVPLGRQGMRDFRDNLLVFYTGQTRDARSVLADQNDNLSRKQDKRGFLSDMVAMVDPFVDSLVAGDYDGCGRVLGEAWAMKKRMSSLIANESIDGYYDRALANGATGGKLLGAGGGGFLLFMAPPDAHARVRAALADLKEVDFEFDFAGSRIIYVENTGG